MVLMAITWLLLGLLIGSAAFFGAGLVAALVLGGNIRDTIGRWYVDMGMAALRNGAMTIRETGSLMLTRVQYDPKYGGDKSIIDGVAGHWQDPLEVKSTLSGRPFGLGLESASAYVSPLTAEIGKDGVDELEDGQLGSSTDGGGEKVTLDFTIPEQPQVLDLRAATKFLEGSCKRRWGEVANRYGELSQEKFHDRFSLGQSLMWIGAFAAGVALGFLIMKYGSDGGGGVSMPIMGPTIAALLITPPAPADDDGRDWRDLLTSSKAKVAYLAIGGVAIAGLMAIVAFFGWGVWSAVGVSIGLVVGVASPWVYVRVLFTPALKGILGKAFFILAQLSFGAGALCRRDDGGYEWNRLQKDGDELHTVLSDGQRVPVDGEIEDLPNVCWAPLAVVEQKTERNMSEWTVDEVGWRSERPDPAEHGESVVKTPLALADGGDVDGWHLDSAKLNRWARGSAGSDLARNGLRKALEEEGGQQKISPLVTMTGAAVLAVLGFGMAAGALML